MKTFVYSVAVNDIEAENEEEAFEKLTDMLANNSISIDLVEVLDENGKLEQ